MFNLVIMLLSTINSEPKDSNNYKIAKYIIEHLRELEDCTLSQLAKNCYVSNSSISRFCRDIGFSDFNELRIQVARIPIAYQKAHNKFKFKEFDENFCRSYVTSVCDNLNHAFTSPTIQKDIEALVNDLCTYQKIAAFGYMQSENMALHLQYDLQTSGKTIYTSLKFTDQIEYIKHADENTLIIIFSDSGSYFEHMFSRSVPLKHSKAKIVMVTSNMEIELPYVTSYIRYNSRHDYASHPYPIMVIADMLCIQYAKRLKKATSPKK